MTVPEIMVRHWIFYQNCYTLTGFDCLGNLMPLDFRVFDEFALS